MAVGAKSDFDRKLVEMYYDKTTFNSNTESKLDQNKVWDCMEMISINKRAVINFKVSTQKKSIA